MIRNRHVLIFLISTLLLGSCGVGSFTKSKSRGIKKVRVNRFKDSPNDNETKAAFQSDHVNDQEPIHVVDRTQSASEEVQNLESATITSDDFNHVDAFPKISDSQAADDSREIEVWEEDIHQTIRPPAPSEGMNIDPQKAFKDLYWAMFFAFMLAMLFGALGFVFYSGSLYLVALLLYTAAFVLSFNLKYKFIRKQPNQSDLKFKNKVWLVNFVFFSGLFFIVLSLIALMVRLGAA